MSIANHGVPREMDEMTHFNEGIMRISNESESHVLDQFGLNSLHLHRNMTIHQVFTNHFTVHKLSIIILYPVTFKDSVELKQKFYMLNHMTQQIMENAGIF